MKILTLYDGTIHSKTALTYACGRVRAQGGELIVLQVFQSGLFVDYDAGPKAKELARAEAERHFQDAVGIIRETGPSMPARMLSEDGDPEEEVLRVAADEHADLVLASPRYKGLIKSAPCPVQIIPGAILLPVDSSERSLVDLEFIVSEAKATTSKVILLGVVPVNLYGAEEEAELEEVRKKTDEEVRRIRTALVERRLETVETVRYGYPDEEILKAAYEYSVSLIMLPAGGKTPSELAKAAVILLDGPRRVSMPIRLLPAGA